MPTRSLSLLAALTLIACSNGSGGSSSNGGLQVACPSGQTVCGSTCVVLTDDPANCGQCAMACASGQACVSAKCTTTCPTGSLLCGNLCVDPLSDQLNCGACSSACTDGTVCTSGSCVKPPTQPVNCGSGLTTCTLNDGGMACVDQSSDSFNCGACGTVCPGGETCQHNQCQPSCVATETACGGLCVETQTDTQNCGGCGTDGGAICTAGEVCSAGHCLASCANPLAFCSGAHPAVDGGFFDGGNPDAGYCADLGSDRLDCGTCGTACTAGSLCVDGQCQLSCPSAGQSCFTPLVLLDAGTFTGNTCCGGSLAFSDGGCVSDPSTLMLAMQLPPGGILDTYTFQLTPGFVGSYTPAICLSQANLTSLTCTTAQSASFPALDQTDYIAVGQLDGGCGQFTLTVGVSSGI